MKVVIYVTEQVVHTMEVEADSEEEALDKAPEQFAERGAPQFVAVLERKFTLD